MYFQYDFHPRACAPTEDLIRKPRVLIIANTVWYLANFRLTLCRALRERGFGVIAVAPPGEDALRLVDAGIIFAPMPMDGGGTNPMKDLGLLLRLVRLLHSQKPTVCLSYTAKPNIYAGLACRMLGIPRIHNIAGLGTTFINETWLTSVMKVLYRTALKGAECVFFQNPDDQALFEKSRLTHQSQSKRLPGSGVDLDRFKPAQENIGGSSERPFRFLLSARMIWEKGVGEFVEATKTLKSEGLDIECWLLGQAGVDNPSAISIQTLKKWEAQGLVKCLGSVEDVLPILRQVDCVTLPSYYREGVPRVLLEACSMGLPIITTDSVGCREAIDDGVTGLMCQPRDADDLARCMRQMVNMPESERHAMGQRGREKMVREFDEKIVIDRYLEAIDQIVSTSA